MESLAEAPFQIPNVAAPVGGDHPARAIACESAVRPIANSGHVPVLDRIEVYVVDVPRQISVVADEVFPVAALPNSPLPLRYLACGSVRADRQTARKAALDQAPT